MDKLRILLADDHKLFREGIRALLEKYQHIEVVGEAENGHQVLDLLQELKPDLILIDLTMPEMNGLDTIPQIRKILPSIHILVLSMHEDGNYIVKSIQSGANAYLFKNVDEEELMEAIKKVTIGEKYFNSKVSELMIETLRKGQVEVNITAREKEILQLVANGLSTKMIADRLFLSTRTVETHRVNIMKKLKVNNTAELIKKAAETNLLD